MFFGRGAGGGPESSWPVTMVLLTSLAATTAAVAGFGLLVAPVNAALITAGLVTVAIAACAAVAAAIRSRHVS